MKQDMAKYFANDLRQVATAEIEQMIPIFGTIQLTLVVFLLLQIRTSPGRILYRCFRTDLLPLDFFFPR